MTRGCTRPRWFKLLARAAEKAGATLVACPDSPLDRAWTEQPPAPYRARGAASDERYTGASAALKKRREVGLGRSKSRRGRCGADAT